MKTKSEIKNEIIARYYGAPVEKADILSDEELARWLCLVERY